MSELSAPRDGNRRPRQRARRARLLLAGAAIAVVIGVFLWLSPGGKPASALFMGDLATSASLPENPRLLSKEEVKAQLADRLAAMRERRASRTARARNQRREYEIAPFPTDVTDFLGGVSPLDPPPSLDGVD